MTAVNTYTRLLLIAGLSVPVGAFTAACSPPAEQAAGDARAPVPVNVATVAMTDLTEPFETGGIVQARTTATVAARILAPVRAVRVVPGDRVRAGQLLVELDGRDLDARARSARAAAVAAEQGATAAAAEERAAGASLELASTTYDRIATLHQKRSATPRELDEATASLRSAEARAAGAAARAREAAAAVEGARGGSEAASATEAYTRITAPFDGTVTDKMIEPGNMAAPGTPLLRIEDTRGFRLDVRVDQSRVGDVSVGAAVPVLLDSGTRGAATTLNGIVSEIARAVDADARSFIVKIELPETAGVRSGMFGRARFPGASRRALAVPAGALLRRGQVTSVFVVDDGVARLRLVSVADGEVLAGLSEGETVIVDPPAAVADGRRVSEGGH
jgi:RND family efflux transporter MFP subunit